MIALPTWLVLVWLAGAGAILASYANLAAVRIPRGQSSVTGASACEACGHKVRPWDNVPVLSWLVLRGRCRDCGARFGVRHLVVELVGAAAFVVAGAVLLPTAGWAALAVVLVMVVGGLVLSLIDLQTHLLPDRVMLPWSIVLAVAMVAGTAVTGDWWALARAGIGAVALFAFYFAAAMAYPAGMGFGDVKLAAPLGAVMAFVGWPALAVGAFCAFLLGAIGSAVLALRGRLRRKTEVPFGPWMVAGALVGVLAGPVIANWYLSVVGLA
ncbi:A24 family peptidase [Cellulosimicrobium sp. Marseille-Q4280]|uniref:prepilin peptidase n=1 Tax=Cellulosimicrobium sp. Marseille-Q4280 TaxID=2937992 RepID=UPI00203B4E59|nr:A24 family peptidase [Cellulosimicrobium sp. Marseille-Q4280]